MRIHSGQFCRDGLPVMIVRVQGASGLKRIELPGGVTSTWDDLLRQVRSVAGSVLPVVNTACIDGVEIRYAAREVPPVKAAFA